MNQILRSFVKRGGSVITGKDVDDRLRAVGASASIIDPDTIMIASYASEMAIREETLHARQLRRFHGEPSQLDEIKMEIEAQHLLLNYATLHGMPYNEVKQLRDNLSYWQANLAELEGGGHSD